MHRMRAVTVEGSLVGEFHHTSKLVALSTRGNIHADGCFHQAGDLSLQAANFSLTRSFCFSVTPGFQRKANMWTYIARENPAP